VPNEVLAAPRGLDIAITAWVCAKTAGDEHKAVASFWRLATPGPAGGISTFGGRSACNGATVNDLDGGRCPLGGVLEALFFQHDFERSPLGVVHPASEGVDSKRRSGGLHVLPLDQWSTHRSAHRVMCESESHPSEASIRTS
jgi:hypothetical protein